MFSTGFSMQPEKLAEMPDGPTTHWMAAKAQELNAVITGSIIALDQNRYYNRLIWMRPDSTFETYDKKHLFGLGDEPAHYSSEEHTSELQSLMRTSYAVFCLKQKNK